MSVVLFSRGIVTAPSGIVSGGGGGGSSTPNITALPAGDGTIGDWNNFPGASWAQNTLFTDVTTSKLRRLTNASWPVANVSCQMEYASGGPRISRRWGTNQAHFIFSVGNSIYCADMQRGVGVDTGSAFAIPNTSGGAIGQCFSSNPSEPHILYVSDRGSPAKISRYDVQARAYAPNAVFSGTNASVSAGGNDAGWLTQTWDGKYLMWITPAAGPTSMQIMDVTTGTTVTYSGVEISLANDPRLGKDSAFRVAALADNTNKAIFYFRDSNLATAFGAGTRAGHSDVGAQVYYAFDPDSSAMPLAVQTFGSVPASDGGAWTGSRTDIYGAGGTAVLIDTDSHPSMAWDQSGKGDQEYYCFDSDYAGPGTFSNAPTGWTLDSGSVYKTGVTFGTGYGAGTRGVTAVQLRDGNSFYGTVSISGTTLTVVSTDHGSLNIGDTIDGQFMTRCNIVSGSGPYVVSVSQTFGPAKVFKVGSAVTGKLNAAASRLAMTVGTFFWDGTILYVWLPGGVAPTNTTVRIMAPTKLKESIGYARQDGLDTRRACFTYRNEEDTLYEHRAFVCFAPDGDQGIFASDLGTTGRVDLVQFEIPVT